MRFRFAIPLATALAATAGVGSAFSQSCTGRCALQAADQEALLAPFNSLPSTAEGRAVLAANLQTENDIYLNSSQADKVASGTILILPAVPANVLIRAFPGDPNYYYDAQGMPTAPALPPSIAVMAADIISNNQIVAMKPYFGAQDVYGEAYGYLPGQTDSYGNPPPYQVSAAILSHPFTPANSSTLAWENQQTPGAYKVNWVLGDSNVGDFPSAHTMLATSTAISFAILAPGYYQQLALSVANFSYDLNVFAVHYPVDVIGGRILATYVMAKMLAGDPLYASSVFNEANLPSLSHDMQAYFGGGASSPYAAACVHLVACLNSGVIPTAATYARQAESYLQFMTYGLPSVGATDLAPVVPAEAHFLIATRYPYLDTAQLNEVLATTELPSGALLDDGSGWARINLYAAAGGYGAFRSNVSVNMDAALGGLNAFDVWSNNISGPGGLTLTGSGTLVLAGDNTFTGGVAVQGGALGLSGSLLGPVSVSSGASFVVGSSGAFTGVLNNDGSVVSSGVVNATVSGAGDFVNSGFLTATGVFGSLDLIKGSTLALGSSIGAITVAGALGVADGAAYRARVEGAAADRIEVGGTAALSGGTVVASVVGASAALGRPYPILTAGAIDGAFANATADNLPFIQPSLSYDANTVFLTLNRDSVPFASVAASANQAAVANALDAGSAESGPGAAVAVQSAASAPGAFDALSGEIHASAVSAAFDASRLPREAVLDRLTSAYDGTEGGRQNAQAMAGSRPGQVLQAWSQGFGSWGRIGGAGAAATTDDSLGGFILGADATLANQYRLGVAGGYTDASLNLPARASSGAVSSTWLGLYGGASAGALQLDGGAFYGFSHFGTERSVVFPGFFDSLGSGYGGDTAQAFAEAGWRVPLPAAGLGSSWAEPFVQAAAVQIHTDGFTESGGVAALIGRSGAYDYGVTTLGARAQANLPAAPQFTANGMIGWRRVYGGAAPDATMAFASQPFAAFSIAGAPIARNALALEGGIDWRVTASVKLGVYYSGLISGSACDNAIKGRIEATF